MALFTGTQKEYYYGPDNLWGSNDENYGNYQFINLKDLINNFIINYVGEDKIISKIKRTDISFHLQRAIQEFSYDIFKSEKSQEIEIPPSLMMLLPHDYVNYVKISWVDDSGIERLLYPARKTSNPLPILQDDQYEYLFDYQSEEILTANESETWKKFKTRQENAQNDDRNASDQFEFSESYGGRIGLEPEMAQSNGTFFIDPLKGKIFFDSNMVGKIVTLKYISDGVATEDEKIVHKFAEDAVYKHTAHAILSARQNVPEYQIARFKKEKFAATRTAKLRLSNLKIEELTQIMRNKGKQIKH